MRLNVFGKLNEKLFPYSVFAAVLSAAALPIYIYAPKFFSETYGLSLTVLATTLFALRFLDVLQDPLLGWLSTGLGKYRKFSIAVAMIALTVSMNAMFVLAAPFAPLVWFTITSTILFTSFSFLSINFYAQGVQKALTLSGGHQRLAAWRETGGLVGICLAAITPTLLIDYTDTSYASFAIGFSFVTFFAWILMRKEWGDKPADPSSGLKGILQDAVLVKLLLLALVNSAPLAVTSTLFLFYVDSVLVSPEYSGVLLVLFFFSAAVSSPVWARLAQNGRGKAVLIGAMCLSIISFSCVLLLGESDVFEFSLICILSGFTIGADLTVLPAIFARRIAFTKAEAVKAFGIWSFVSKFSLALAAIILLPALEYFGYQSGNKEQTLKSVNVLVMLYALTPCLLKAMAIAILVRVSLKED